MSPRRLSLVAPVRLTLAPLAERLFLRLNWPRSNISRPDLYSTIGVIVLPKIKPNKISSIVYLLIIEKKLKSIKKTFNLSCSSNVL